MVGLLRIRCAKAEDDGYWYIRPAENRYHRWYSLYLANKLDLLGSGQLYADVSLGYVEWMETEVVSSEAELNDPTTDEFTISLATACMTQNRSLRCLHWEFAYDGHKSDFLAIMQSFSLSAFLCWHPPLGQRMRSIRMDPATTYYRKA